MTTLILHQDNINSKKGKIIYKKGGNLAKIADIMENAIFRKFYKDNFKTWSDIQTVVMFMKIYEKIEEVNPNLSMYDKVAFLEKVMENSETRKYVVNEMLKWKINENKFLEN